MRRAAAPGNQATPPWLSLLIPAYEHPSGVSRILQSLATSTEGGVECIISDDSASEAVANIVRPYLDAASPLIRYQRNKPALGAPGNWNRLLAQAKGDYVLLLHHDEFPEDGHFFEKLRQEIVKQSRPDVIVLNCMVPAFGMKRLRQHQPSWLQGLMLKHVPSMLALHNVVGPPSALVLKSTRRIDFDIRLKWLVDVEWMMRIFSMEKIRWIIAPTILLVSHPNPDVSITKQIKPQLREIRRREALLLSESIDSRLVSAILAPRSWPESLLAQFERLLWIGFRFFVVACLLLQSRSFPRPSPPSTAQQP